MLFRTDCLALHGSALWNTSSKSMNTLEVSFNKVLRRIWKLLRNSHTSIVHCTSHLQSLFNQTQVLQRSHNLLSTAEKCSSMTVRDIFLDSSELCYTIIGYNRRAGSKFENSYSITDMDYGTIIRNIRECKFEFQSLIDVEDLIITLSCD